MKRKKKKGPKISTLSFRFSDETVRRLKVLAEYYGESNTGVLEGIIDETYEKLRSNDKAELRKIEKNIK